MTGTDRPTGLSRRRFLVAGGGVAAGPRSLPAAAASPPTRRPAAGQQQQEQVHRQVHRLRRDAGLLERLHRRRRPVRWTSWSHEFQQANPKIKVSRTRIQWADFYQKVPAAVHGRQGPGRRRHAPGPARHQRRPQGDPAGRRRRRRRLDLRSRTSARRCGRPASTRASATASRSTSTRSPCTTTTESLLQQAGVPKPPTDEATFDQALDEMNGRRRRDAVLDAVPLAGAPDVPLAAVAERRRAVRRGRQQGAPSTPTPASRPSPGCVDQVEAGLQPRQRRDRHPVRSPSRTARAPSPGTASGRSTTSRPPRGPRLGAWRRSPPSATSRPSGPTRTTSAVTAADAPDDDKAAGRPRSSSTGSASSRPSGPAPA